VACADGDENRDLRLTDEHVVKKLVAVINVLD
jgi:hypothetical protein